MNNDLQDTPGNPNTKALCAVAMFTVGIVLIIYAIALGCMWTPESGAVSWLPWTHPILCCLLVGITLVLAFCFYVAWKDFRKMFE